VPSPAHRYWIIALVSLLLVAALSRLGRRAQVQTDGWQRIAPGPLHWTSLVLGGGLFLLCLYVRLFVGSSRPDAEVQMRTLTWLILGFGAAALLSGWMIRRTRRRQFEWRGESLRWRAGPGETVVRDVRALSSVRASVPGSIRLDFEDGASVTLDEHALGCRELISSLAEQRPDLLSRAARGSAPW